MANNRFLQSDLEESERCGVGNEVLRFGFMDPYSVAVMSESEIESERRSCNDTVGWSWVWRGLGIGCGCGRC